MPQADKIRRSQGKQLSALEALANLGDNLGLSGDDDLLPPDQAFRFLASVEDASRALFVTGFPYYRREIVDDLLARVKRVLMTGHGLRRSGSAALDMAWLAAGRTDAFWEEGLEPYDVAAGLGIIQAAGGRITDWEGQPYRFGGNEICATNGRIHDEVLAAVGAPAPRP